MTDLRRASTKTMPLEEFFPGDAELYRRAAELMTKGDYCIVSDCGWSCCALSAAVPKDAPGIKTYFRLQRRLRALYGDAAWWGGPKTPENQAARLEAMRVMAGNAEALSEFVP